jgi:hypothetical protein
MGIIGKTEMGAWRGENWNYWEIRAAEGGRWKIRVIRIGRVRETTGGSMVEVTD